MTSQERILTALRKKQPDTVPVLVFLNPFTEDNQSWTWEEPSYRELLECVKTEGDVVHLYSPNSATSGICLVGEDVNGSTKSFILENGEEFTERTVTTPKGNLTSVRQKKYAGGTKKYFVENEEDLKKILSLSWSLPKKDFNEFFRNKEILGKRGTMLVDLPDPVCALEFLNPELRAFWSVDKRNLLVNLLETVFIRQMEALEHTCANIASPDVVFHFYGPEHAIPPLMSPKDFHDFVVKYDTRLIEKVHSYGCLTIIHSHGKINNFLEKFREMGTDGLNCLEPPPMGDCSLSDAKRRIGQDVCLMGNIEYSDLAMCSSEEIKRKVRECIAQAGKGGGFILMPTASPYEIPISRKTSDNFIAMIKECRKYGR